MTDGRYEPPADEAVLAEAFAMAARQRDRYVRLRAAVVTVVDAEFGDDVPAIRQLLLDALDDEDEAEFVEAMDAAAGTCTCGTPWPCDFAGLYPHRRAAPAPGGGTDG